MHTDISFLNIHYYFDTEHEQATRFIYVHITYIHTYIHRYLHNCHITQDVSEQPISDCSTYYIHTCIHTYIDSQHNF